MGSRRYVFEQDEENLRLYRSNFDTSIREVYLLPRRKRSTYPREPGLDYGMIYVQLALAIANGGV